MKTSKRSVCIIIILVIVLGGIIFFAKKNTKKEEDKDGFTEYTPQEEISSEQLRQTLVTLYFKNKTTGALMPEARMIDSKVLLNEPYKKLIELLIEGPKNDSLEKVIPNDTVINSVKFEKGIVYIDFSKDFIKTETMGAEEELKIVNSIVNTLTELTEVEGVKFLIDGEGDLNFESGKVKLNDTFKRAE